MNRASSTTAAKQGAPIRPVAQLGSGRGLRQLVAACLVFWTGCATATTSVNQLWLDSARPRAPLGKTLVVAVLRDPQVATALEREWARQLRARGIEATAVDALGPGVRPPGRAGVEALVRQHGFDTVLVSRLADIKHIDRDDASAEVAVVENKLYDGRTGQPFWSAQTDTFLTGSSGGAVRLPAKELIQGFVNTLIAEMVKAKLL